MKTAEEIYNEAQILDDSNDYKAKIEKLEDLLQNYPEFAPAHDQLGSIYYQLQKYETALSHFENAAKFSPDNIRIQKNLGDFYYTVLSRNEDALMCYRKILDSEPEDIETNMIAANLLVSLRRFEEAKKLYRKVLDLEPWRMEVQQILDKIDQHDSDNAAISSEKQYEYAQILLQNNDAAGAMKILEKLVTKDPKFAVAHNDLGVLNYQMGKPQEAQKCYETAVSLDPENINFKKNLAEYHLFVTNEIEKALVLYLDILKDHPYDIETLMVAAKISEKFNRKDDAIVFYEAVLDIEPWNLEASENLSVLTSNGSGKDTSIG